VHRTTPSRACELAEAKVRLRLKSGEPALVSHRTGQGCAYLLGFCLQDSYFRTYRDGDSPARSQLYSLISNLFRAANVRAHIHCSNPDIEASLRANSVEGYVFIINHEAVEPQAAVQLADLGFPIRRVVDVESGKTVPFHSTRDGIEFRITAPFGSTGLLRITP